MNKCPVHYNLSSDFTRHFTLFRWMLPLSQNYTYPNNYLFPAFIYTTSALRRSSSAVRSVSPPAKMCCDVAKTSSEAAKMLSVRARTSRYVTNVSSVISMINKNVTKVSSELPKVCCEKAKTFSKEAKIPFGTRKPDFFLKISNTVTNKHNLLVINDYKFQTQAHNVYKTLGALLFTTK